jgi:predicted RNase H-like HicB family nuclease
MQFEYTMQIWKEGNHFVAQAMPLDVMSAGASPEAARQALEEAVRLFLLTAQDNGTLSEVLAECGYEQRDGVWAAPPPVVLERHSTAVVV